MKTHKVRPVLVETKENTGITLGINITRNIPGKMRGTNYQLILISLEDEKIEVGDKYVVELFNVTGESRGNVLEECTGINDVWINKYDVTTTRHINNCYKVIVTQSQLSPELIQQLVDEYNNDGMKDFEIEMEYHDKPMSDLFLVQKPKLTNGFVTVVKKEPILYTEKEVKQLLKDCAIDLSQSVRIKAITEQRAIEWFEQNKKK